MADQPRQTLCDLIQRFGADLATDPKRCEALLKDLLPNGFKREVNALVTAAREGVPSELRQPAGGTPLPAVVVQQARKLHEDLGLDQSLAEWAVKTWAVALGVKLTVANPPTAKTPAPVPKVFTPVPMTPTEPPASFQWVLTQTGEIAPAPKTPAALPPRAAIPTSPSGFDLAKRLRDQQARQQQERDDANLVIAEARRLVDEEQDIPGAEQLLLSLPEGLRDNDLLAEVHRMRDELAKQQARQERNRVIKKANRHIAEAQRVIKSDHDYATAAHLLEAIPRQLCESDARLDSFVADVRRKRDRVVELERHIVAEGHADRFDFLRPCVEEFITLQPQRDDMQELLAALPQVAAEWTNSLGIRFKRIQPGSFLMGDNSSGEADEKPAHQVTITRPFYCGVFPVTQAEYQAVTGQGPSHFQGERRPVETVSWDEAMAFCAKLNQRYESNPPGMISGMIYRLLSEAEWEYCCRAGTTTSWCCQSERQLSEYAWYSVNAGSQTHDVGTKKANAWGLHDFHGNVWESCLDWKGSYGGGAVKDPVNLVWASSQVYRGGCWSYGAADCRSANRHGTPDYRHNGLGFRVALGPEIQLDDRLPDSGRRRAELAVGPEIQLDDLADDLATTTSAFGWLGPELK